MTNDNNGILGALIHKSLEYQRAFSLWRVYVLQENNVINQSSIMPYKEAQRLTKRYLGLHRVNQNPVFAIDLDLSKFSFAFEEKHYEVVAIPIVDFPVYMLN